MDDDLQIPESIEDEIAQAFRNVERTLATAGAGWGDFVTALGDITMKDEDGKAAHYSYFDIWCFRGGKIVELRAFVIKTEVKDETSGSSARADSMR